MFITLCYDLHFGATGNMIEQSQLLQNEILSKSEKVTCSIDDSKILNDNVHLIYKLAYELII